VVNHGRDSIAIKHGIDALRQSRYELQERPAVRPVSDRSVHQGGQLSANSPPIALFEGFAQSDRQ
jgi:hypothetical protein